MEPIILTYEQFRKQTEEIQNTKFEQPEPESTFDKKAETFLKSKGWSWDERLQVYVIEKKGFWYSIKQTFRKANYKQSLQWEWKKYKGTLETANPVGNRKVSSGFIVTIDSITKITE